jgi:hypothetical protein
MASGIRIIGVPVQDNHTVWVIDHIMWWPVDELMGETGQETKDPRFHESIDSTLYLDYVGIFNAEEFVKLNDGYKAKFLKNTDKKHWHVVQRQLMRVVDDTFKQRHDTKWILVEKYEWESGME